MSSKGRKIAKNLGKSLRKKFDPDLQTDDLEQTAELDFASKSTGHQAAASGGMKSSSSTVPSSAISKSTSLSTIGNDAAESGVVDHSEILALTHHVKNFSDTLAKLKVLFIEGLESGDDARVVLQNSLGEVLAVLKNTMLRYQDLKTPEIFTAARVLINKIKSHSTEDLQLNEEELQFYLDAIDQVALAFSRSVSDYLMGDIVTQQQQQQQHQQQQLNMDSKVMSCDNIVKAAQQEEKSVDKQEPKKILTPAELDSVLVGLEAGLDLSLQRAKAWSRYIRDIIAYIEKKSQLEMEYAKNLARIAHGMQPVLTNEGFLPLQSIFCTALSQDAEFASNLQASQALLHTSKFVEPLASRRNEHDRVRKSVKETWDREVRKMQDIVNNLRKAQALYVSRQQELERIRETLQKADGEKMEKRKKSEEESLHKSAEAETTYKACVAEANHKQRSLERTKVDLLSKVREQIYLCDQVIKSVTVDYFSLLHTVWSPVPVQYQTLCESSNGYEPGCQYAEFIKRLPTSSSRPSRSDEFAFEAYTQGQKGVESRKISVHSNGSSGDHIHSNEGSPLSSPRKDKYRIPVKAWGQNSSQTAAAGGSDTDSASGSNKSHESSPSSSPHDLLRRQIVSSQSLEDLAEEDVAKVPSAGHQKRGQMKRTMTVGEDSLDLPAIMNQQGRRNTMFGVDFQEQVEHYKSQVPPIITKCLAEIERRGLMIKGIYRVSGVKSKVENLCQRFDLNPELVDLEEVHPNIISNVLKLYLRQLPEPLLTFRLYSDFIHLAKENMAGYLSGDKMVERLAALVHKLPPSNFRTCAVLMHHLQRVAAHSDMNQMSSSNLGIVFGPTLLRPLEGTASLASLVDTPHQTRAVELLITSAEAVFGPGDDYQLVPDQTPVEALEETAEDISFPVPSSSSEPSPERSQTKDDEGAFPAPAPQPVTSNSLTAAVLSSSPTPVLSGQIEDGGGLVTHVVHSTPSLEPSDADFSLPGCASPNKYHKDAVVHGQALSAEWDDASLFTLDDDDDDLAEVMLPDQSQEPNSQTHTPLLTPHCIAEPKLVVKSETGSKPSDREVGLFTTAPLADMEPVPDATLPICQTVATIMDSSTWPGASGQGLASVPTSPTIKPIHTSSFSDSSVADGRLSPTKDSRADRFKVEQRKLLSAIKSDPKLGITEEEGLPTAKLGITGEEGVPTAKLGITGEEGIPTAKLGITGEEGVPTANLGITEEEGLPAAKLSLQEDEGDHISGDGTAAVEITASFSMDNNTEPTFRSVFEVKVKASSANPTAEKQFVEVSDQQTVDQPKAVFDSASEVTKIDTKEETKTVLKSQPPKNESSFGGGKDRGEPKTKRFERSGSGGKSQENRDVPTRSGIRLGTGPSSTTDLSGARSPPTVTSKYSTTINKAGPSSVGASQRRNNITGLIGSTTSSAVTSTKSVLSRYPPASTSPLAVSRRPIASHPPPSTALSRSSSGSGTARQSTTSSLGQVHLKTEPSATASASVSAAHSDLLSSVSSGSRVQRVSGEKNAGALKESSPLSRGSGNGSLTKSSIGIRTGVGSSRTATAASGTFGRGGSGSGIITKAGTNGASRASSSVSKSNSAAKPVSGVFDTPSRDVGHKSGTCLSATADSIGAIKALSSLSDSRVTAGSSSSRQFPEKIPDDRSADTGSHSLSGAKDLCSDRTPRFV